MIVAMVITGAEKVMGAKRTAKEARRVPEPSLIPILTRAKFFGVHTLFCGELSKGFEYSVLLIGFNMICSLYKIKS
jgi:hypothetical protein